MTSTVSWVPCPVPNMQAIPCFLFICMIRMYTMSDPLSVLSDVSSVLLIAHGIDFLLWAIHSPYLLYTT
jgi:hypothetical protein